MTAYAPCELWRHPPADVLERLERTIERASGQQATLFFRADDIGLPGRQLARMTDLFVRHEVPLALAVVPTWLPLRHTELKGMLASGGSLWCLHQHGFRHANHEQGTPSRKKSEFGSARSAEAKQRDISRGRDILESYLAGLISPLFTPPWNRCDGETLDILACLCFRAVSRSAGAQPAPPTRMMELAVNVDLHTRKEPTAQAAFGALLEELEQSLATGLCGIMLHHQRMNRAALEFLDSLLAALKRAAGLRLAHPTDLIR
ncbi:MAG: DUF2334 domain-containing protein [Desulfocurvibacter africanus]